MRDEIGLRRQWSLLRALSARHAGLTLRQMADDLGVTERTVRRDLDVFRGVGFPLEEAVGRFGRKTWRITAVRDQPQLAFTFDEAVALYLGRRMLDSLAGTPFGEAARNAYQKVHAALGPGARAYVERFSGLFHRTDTGYHDYAVKGELIDALMIAIEDGRAVRLVYRSEGAVGATAREVHPYGLTDHRGALYLVAHDPRAGRIKHYKIDRVEGAEVGPGTFRRPEGFDLAAYMTEAFGVFHVDGAPTDVTVRFGPEVAGYVRESRWHRSLRLTPQPDGGLLAEFRVSGTEEIKRWVLGFGAKAIVMAPGSLRREIALELRALAASYAKGTSEEAPPDGAPESPGRRDRRHGRQAVNRGS